VEPSSSLALGSEGAIERFRALMDSLQDTRASVEGPYTFQHQYDDFHTVIGTPAGARVYAQIDALLCPPPVPANLIHDTARLVHNNALASVRAQIMLILGGGNLRSTEQAINNEDFDPRD
jgi:hypothetical protein